MLGLHVKDCFCESATHRSGLRRTKKAAATIAIVAPSESTWEAIVSV